MPAIKSVSMNLLKVLIPLSLAAVLFFTWSGEAWAFLNVDQAFGQRSITSVKGIRADIWTAQHNNNYFSLSSPVGVCTSTPPCAETAGVFETGYIIGQQSNGQLKQYVAWDTKPAS